MKDENSVDFLKQKYSVSTSEKTPKSWHLSAKVFIGIFAILAIGGMFFSYRIARTQSDTGTSSGLSLLGSVKQLVTSGDKQLDNTNGRVNFLLLGHGGYGHDGPELTDTIIFASADTQTHDLGMLSIPRDLAVPIDGYGYHKINHVNAYAEIEEAGSGPQATADAIGDMLEQDIHYYLKVDFQGFEDVIDAIGGVDIYVERSFSDPQYPTDDDLVQTVTFEEGWQHMDGETALQYARSRHGNNGEGSDFARARRQQNVLLAVKDEVLSASTLLSPGKINKLIDVVRENVKTNLTFWEMTKLAGMAADFDTDSVRHMVLDSSTESPLYSTTINGSYVLLPKQDDWSEIQSIAEHIMTIESIDEFARTDMRAPIQSVALEIQNGTNVTGLAFQTSQLLAGSGFDVVSIGNADSRTYTKTIIYDLTEGKKSEELQVLEQFFKADVAMTTTGWIYADEVVPRELTLTNPAEDYSQSTDTIDFLIILGQDAEQLVMY